MKIVTPDLTSLAGSWDTAKGSLSDQLETMTTSITAGWEKEHNSDGSHHALSADTIKIGGVPLGVPTDLVLNQSRFFTGNPAVFTPFAAGAWMRYVQNGSLVNLYFNIGGTFVYAPGAEPLNLFVELPEFNLSLVPTLPKYITRYGIGNFYWQENVAGVYQRSGLGRCSISHWDPAIFTGNPTGTTLELLKNGAAASAIVWSLNPAGFTGLASDYTEIYGSLSFLVE